MPPISFVGAGILEHIRCSAPLSDRRLSLENKTSNPRACMFFELGSNVLATAVLRIKRSPHIVMKFADGNALVAVLLAPERKPVRYNLPAAIALLRFANSLDRILAAKSEQRVANPETPLLEASQSRPGRHIC